MSLTLIEYVSQLRQLKGPYIGDGVHATINAYELADAIEERIAWKPFAEAPKEGVYLVCIPGEHRPWQVMYAHPNVKIIGSVFAFDLPQPTHFLPFSVVVPPGV